MMVVIERIWDRTTLFVNEHLSPVLRIAIGTIFVPCSINGAMSAAANGSGAPSPVASVVMIAATLILFWGLTSLIAYALTPGQGHSSALRLGGRRLPLVLLVGLLSMLAIGIAVMPAVVALAAGGFDFQAAAAGHQQAMSGGRGSAFAALYIVVLPLALLVLVARLLPMSPVIVGEGRSIGAFARAWRLTRGATWKLIGVLLLYLVVSFVAVMATRSVFGTLLQLIAPTPGPLGVATVVTATLVAAVQTTFAVLAVIFCAELYRWTNTAVAAARVA